MRPISFKVTDVVVDGIKTSLLQHLHLCKEFVRIAIIAFLNEAVLLAVKKDTAVLLTSTPRSQVFSPGKPALSHKTLQVKNSTLGPFIGQNTRLIFLLYHAGDAWFDGSPDVWNE